MYVTRLFYYVTYLKPSWYGTLCIPPTYEKFTMHRPQRQEGMYRYEESLIDRSLSGYCSAQKRSRTVAAFWAAGMLDMILVADRSLRQDKDFVNSGSVPAEEEMSAVVGLLDQRVAVYRDIVAEVVAPVVNRFGAAELWEVACVHHRVSIWMKSIRFVGLAFAAEIVAGTTSDVRL